MGAVTRGYMQMSNIIITNGTESWNNIISGNSSVCQSFSATVLVCRPQSLDDVIITNGAPCRAWVTLVDDVINIYGAPRRAWVI